jgi:hypothetical protein
MKRMIFFIGVFFVLRYEGVGQIDSIRIQNNRVDSIYISSVEDWAGRPKVLHAEPLYIDLIRDLGARKGEKEWNFAAGIEDNLGFDEIKMLVEYEFAPVDRLGIEIEVPLRFYSPQKNISGDSIPDSGVESLKMAAQWSILVSERLNTSLAIGYIHEFTINSFREVYREVLNGHVFNPFFIAAKRWGQNMHTLIYTGPWIERANGYPATTRFDVNTSMHYMIPGTRNFAGIEVNKNFRAGDFDMVVRPQMRLGIAHNLLVGIVGGIPVKRENHRFSMFTRLIWEPGDAKRKHGQVSKEKRL